VAVKPGLRLQILLLLGLLLALGFLPLYFAVEAYLSAALAQSDGEQGRALSHALAAYVGEASRTHDRAGLEKLLRAEVDRGTVAALAVYDMRGERIHALGAEEFRRALPSTLRAGDATRTLQLEHGSALRVAARVGDTAVACVLPRSGRRAQLLTRLLGLYMGLIAALLLAAAYFTLTRWIVTPVAQLSLAAERVARTARRLEPPETASRELSDLSRSLQVMTERLLAEEQALRNKVVEVEQATEQLKATQAQLLRSERMASVGQLAAGLAHEVGNPIAAMMGMQDLILSGGMSSDEQVDFIARMRKETERIHRILRDLLDFARPVRGTDAATPGSVEVAVHETTALLLPQPVARRVELEVDVFPDLPHVTLRQEQLVQVLLNLLLNAAQACKEGGKVRVGARQEGANVVLVVQDDGPGVSKELGDRIFEPFVSSKEVGEGSGLGLSVCRGLVEAVGGNIRVESPERGARFVVTLPVAEPASAAS
jgi:signal transduction histidine kinase